jgi:hypothetical protein
MKKYRRILVSGAVLVVLYFIAYAMLQRPLFYAAGYFSRVPWYVNPVTHVPFRYEYLVCDFFEPAYRLDVLIRPHYWSGEI